MNILDFFINKCIKKYLSMLFVPKSPLYQPRSRVSNLFNFKDVVNTKLRSHIVTNLCAVAATQLIIVKLKGTCL